MPLVQFLPFLVSTIRRYIFPQECSGTRRAACQFQLENTALLVTGYVLAYFKHSLVLLQGCDTNSLTS